MKGKFLNFYTVHLMPTKKPWMQSVLTRIFDDTIGSNNLREILDPTGHGWFASSTPLSAVIFDERPGEEEQIQDEGVCTLVL